MTRPRARGYQRIYKACVTCRSKKTRCIVDATPGGLAGVPCNKCRRESRQCSFTSSLGSQGTLASPVPASTDYHRRTAGHASEGYTPSYAPSRAPPSSISRRPVTRTSLRSSPRDGDASDVARRIPDFGAVSNPSSHTRVPLRDAVMRTVISRNEDAMRLLAQSGQPNSGQTNITSAEHFGSSPVLDSTMNAHRRTWPDELPLSQPEPDILRLWESFRFVRMGWLTAAEAVTYVDLFFKNFAPLSPIVDDYYWYHQNHYQLITQEPLLCCSILSVSCRYHTLRGGGGPSRNVLLHQRIWRHCEHLVSRIVLGQEKRSKAKTRTFRSIQALLILTEWYPRAIHFPPEADGWDSSLIFLVPDERDEPGSNQADGAAHVAAKWLEDVVAPARMGDRMSWMFLGCAMSLGHELGVFQARTNDGPSGVRRHKDAANYPWMRKLLYIADQQFSARLNCTSMIPMSLDLSISDSAPSDDGPANFSSSLINSWFGLSQLARSISGTVFSSTAVTRQLLQSHGYVNVVRYFQQQLSRWRESNLDILDRTTHSSEYENLASEYHYTCILLNSLGMQAVVDRAFGSGTRTASPTTSQAPLQGIPSVQASITTTDYSFIQQVIDGSCQVLQGVSRLAQSNALSHCTVRILLRAIAASIFLLKALSMGAPTTRLDESLCTLQRGIEALRGSTWDDMHLASRYAALLELHVAHLRRSFVAGTAPDGIPIPDFNNSDATLGADGSIIGGYGSTGHFAGEEWLSLPFDVSMAPFGVTGNESAQFLGLDDGDWDFLWGLPLV